MQINSSWFPQLEKSGINKEVLKSPCTNIMVGTWILAQKIQTYVFNWTAIQRYNGSDTQLKYAQKVYTAIKKYYPNLSHSGKIVFNNTESSIIKQKKSHFLYVN